MRIDSSRGIALLLVAALVLALFPVGAAAASRSGGAVVVDAGETVHDDLTASGGSVVVRGTVDGNLTAYAGSVVVEGNVTGTVTAYAGSVRIAGNVGDVTAAGGSVVVERGGRVDGALAASAGDVVVDGAVTGGVRADADTLHLGPEATVGGAVTYSENLQRAEGATVGGAVTRNPDLTVGGGGPSVPQFPGWLFGVYATLVNLFLGAILLLVFPNFSRSLAARVADAPLRTTALGLVALIGIPVGLVILLFTVIGIPLSMAGFFVYLLGLWAAYVYGAYAVGSWGVSAAGTSNRWLGLLVGVVVAAVLVRAPYVGWLVRLLLIVVGGGALVWTLYDAHGRASERAPAAD